jgi:hypothetical protein
MGTVRWGGGEESQASTTPKFGGEIGFKKMEFYQILIPKIFFKYFFLANRKKY